MKNTLKYIFIIISSIFFSCESKVEKKELKAKTTFFREDALSSFYPDSKLILNARFDECGEWGGHNEEMVIYMKPKMGFYLDYKKFTVNCDSMDQFYMEPYQKLELSKTIKLNNSNKLSISNYLERMLKSKIDEGFPGHSGNSFTAIKSDSTFYIRIYDKKKEDIDSYNKLQKELGFVPTSIKEPE